MICKIPGVKGNLNNVIDLKAIMARGKNFNREMRELDDSQAEMRTKGTAHLTNVMNDYDLLPVNNFKLVIIRILSRFIRKYIKRDLRKVFLMDAG